MDAVTDDDQNAGRPIATIRVLAGAVRMAVVMVMIVTMVIMAMMIVIVVVMSVWLVATGSVAFVPTVIVSVPALLVPILAMTIRMRVPPEHELLDNKKDPQAHEQRDTDSLRPLRSNTLDRLGQECQQRGAQQCARRITDEVR